MHFTSSHTTIMKLFLSLILLSIFIQPALSRSCLNLGNVPGEYDCDITIDGKNREYTLLVPSNYSPNSGNAVLVDMHGFNGNRFNHPPFSGWRSKALQEGFIYVSPQGIGNSWNADICCGGNREADVAFLKAIINEIDSGFNLNSNRIFASGHSNGGGMSHKLACDAADVFTGIASVSFPIPRNQFTCNPARPLTVLHFHGLSDFVVRYSGGSFGSLSAPESFDTWGNILNCRSGPEITYTKNNAYCETYSNCDGAKSTTLCTINGNHFLYNNSDQLNIPDVAWDYLTSENDDGGDDDPDPSDIRLSASTGSFWFWRWADLSWSNAQSNSVVIYKNGGAVVTTANDGSYREFFPGNGAIRYRICEATNLDNCSNEVTINL